MKEIKILSISALCIFLFLCCACRSTKNSSEVDSVSGATHPVSEELEEHSVTAIPAIQSENEKTRAIVFVDSVEHGNTQRVAETIALKINAPVLDIKSIDMEKINFSALEDYALIGFGSGIDSGRHYRRMLDFAENLPELQNKNAFIFSTCSINDKKMKNHDALKKILQNRGFCVIGEFSCLGHNANSFLKWFGGINKGRPNTDDLRNAEQFALTLLQE